jgi:broad specificity phosphatase PhoE
MADFAKRVTTTLQNILEMHQGKQILIVGHRGTNRVLLGTLLKIAREQWREIRVRNKFLYRIQPDDQLSVATFSLSEKSSGSFVQGLLM